MHIVPWCKRNATESLRAFLGFFRGSGDPARSFRKLLPARAGRKFIQRRVGSVSVRFRVGLRGPPPRFALWWTPSRGLAHRSSRQFLASVSEGGPTRT